MKKPPFSRRDCIKSLTAIGMASALGAWMPLARAQPKLIIGAIYVGTRDDYGYNQSHALAIGELKKLANVQVVEEEKVPETIAVQKAMEGLIKQDNATLILPTSFGYFDPHVLAVAPKYPDIRFAHCGGLWTENMPKNIGSFFGYIEECQFLNGIIAGHMSKSRKIGFIAAKPVAQVVRNINAFVLGARAVNPEITCNVIFTGDWSLPIREAEAANSLIDQGIDVITMHVDSPKVIIETAAKRGTYVCGYHTDQSKLAPAQYLTGAEWHWYTAYKIFADAALEGKPQPNFIRGGLKEGFVRMSAYGSMVPEAARRQADDIKAKMLAGEFSIFTSGLKDNKGKVVVPSGINHKQTDIELESMNYLVEGAIGSM